MDSLNSERNILRRSRFWWSILAVVILTVGTVFLYQSTPSPSSAPSYPEISQTSPIKTIMINKPAAANPFNRAACDAHSMARKYPGNMKKSGIRRSN